MTHITAWFAHPLAEAIGWTLLHFVWQGAAVAAALAVGLAILKERSAQGRYLLACGALAAMILLPMGTLARCWPGSNAAAEQAGSAQAGMEQAGSEQGRAVKSIVPPHGVAIPQEDVEAVEPVEQASSMAMSPEAMETPANAHSEYVPVIVTEKFWLAWHGALRPFIPWLVAAWFTGALLLSLRLLSIWIGVQRLCRVEIAPASNEARSMLARLVRQMEISQPVRLLQSTLVEVPTVIGWLTPVILLPASALVGLAPVQLEALLVHELAHIRRWDYLVNLVQSAIETLLFYHPAVWWVSGRIRQERENCCDDLAALLCGDRVRYAEALVRMEELRAPAGQMALAARGGNLLERVRRLVITPERDRLPPWWQAGGTALLVLGSLAASVWLVSTGALPSHGADNQDCDLYLVAWHVFLDHDAADRLFAGEKAAEGVTSADDKLRGMIVDGGKLRAQIRHAIETDAFALPSQTVYWAEALGADQPLYGGALTKILSFSGNQHLAASKPSEAPPRFNVNFQTFYDLRRSNDGGRDEAWFRLKGRVSAEIFDLHGEAPNDHASFNTEVGCDIRLLPRQALVLKRPMDKVSRWSPTLVTVLERADVPHGDSKRYTEQVRTDNWLRAGADGASRNVKLSDEWVARGITRIETPDEKWSRTLPNGARVTLVALARPRLHPLIWWTPDGKPVHFDCVGYNSSGYMDEEMVALLQVVQDWPEGTPGPPIELGNLRGRDLFMSQGVTYVDRKTSGPATIQLVRLGVKLREPGLPASIEIGAGSGAWQDSGALPAKPGEESAFDEGIVRLNQLVIRTPNERIPWPVEATATYRFPSRKDLSLVAVLKNGAAKLPVRESQIHLPWNDTWTSYYGSYPPEASDVDHFAIRLRPLDWARFEGFVTLPEELAMADKEPAAGQADDQAVDDKEPDDNARGEKPENNAAQSRAADKRDVLDPITGSVVDTQGKPVAGARVVLRMRGRGERSGTREPAPGRDLAQTVCDAQGAFEFRGVAVPDDPHWPTMRATWQQYLDVVALAPRHAAGWVHLGQAPAKEQKITLAPAVSLPGRIVNGKGEPVVGAEVRVRYLMSVRHIGQADLEEGRWPGFYDHRYLSLSESKMAAIAARTDADGRFALDGLPAGLGAYLEVEHPDYMITKMFATISPDAMTDEERALAKRRVQSGVIGARLEPGHRLSVRVVAEESGEPVAGALYAIPPIVDPPTGVADEQGRFEYRHLTDGTHSITIYPPPGSDRLPVAMQLSFQAGAYKHEQVAKMPRGIPVRGRVMDAVSGRGIAGVSLRWSGMTPIASHLRAQDIVIPQGGSFSFGTVVDLPPNETPETIRTAYSVRVTTDADGAFRTAVPPGKVNLQLDQAVDWYRGTQLPLKALDVPELPADGSAPAPLEDVVLRLTPVAPMTGRVIDPEGKPAAGVEIFCRWQRREGHGHLSREWVRQTDAEGRFTLPDMFDSNSQSLNESATAYFHDDLRRLGAVVLLGMQRPQQSPQEVRLAPMRTVTGRVVDKETGKPIRSAVVTLRRSDTGIVGDSYYVASAPVRTGMDGRFSLPVIPSGTEHYVEPQATGYGSFSAYGTRFTADDRDHDVGDLMLERRKKK